MELEYPDISTSSNNIPISNNQTACLNKAITHLKTRPEQKKIILLSTFLFKKNTV